MDGEVKTSSAKAKGRRLQQKVRDDLIATLLGVTADDVGSRSTSAPGEDILLSPAAREQFPFSIECKNVERLNVHEAFDQCLENCGPHMPLLVMAKNRTPEPLAVLRWSDLLSIIRATGGWDVMGLAARLGLR